MRFPDDACDDSDFRGPTRMLMHVRVAMTPHRRQRRVILCRIPGVPTECNSGSAAYLIVAATSLLPISTSRTLIVAVSTRTKYARCSDRAVDASISR